MDLNHRQHVTMDVSGVDIKANNNASRNMRIYGSPMGGGDFNLKGARSEDMAQFTDKPIDFRNWHRIASSRWCDCGANGPTCHVGSGTNRNRLMILNIVLSNTFVPFVEGKTFYDGNKDGGLAT